ncbi:MAG: response regulator [Crocinitomicaceae bacterium]|nr:response regulator [Crocinitomicaceae bacterium]
MKKILIIEDVDDIRENASELLELNDFEVLTAHSGEEGLNTLKNNPVDLILCDIVMPGMNGYKVLEEIRKNTDLAKIPFVYMSASVQENEKREALSMGIDGFIQKPFFEEDMLKVIKSALNKEH